MAEKVNHNRPNSDNAQPQNNQNAGEARKPNRPTNINVPPAKDIEKTLEILATARVRTHNLIAEGRAACEDLLDQAAVKRVETYGSQVLAQLGLVAEFCNNLLQTVEALESRGRGRSTLDALYERRAELDTLIALREQQQSVNEVAETPTNDASPIARPSQRVVIGQQVKRKPAMGS